MVKKNNNIIWVIIAIVVALFLYQNYNVVQLNSAPSVPQEPTTTPTFTTGGGGGSGGGGGTSPDIYWCYQEDPIVENQTNRDGYCGLNYDGSWNSGGPGTWTYEDGNNESFDGDWSTYNIALAATDPWAEYSLTYYLPNATICNISTDRSLWFVKGEGLVDSSGYTIPQSCWDYAADSHIIFTIVSRNNETLGYYGAFQCYNGTHYPVIKNWRDTTTAPRIYEEAMYWACQNDYANFEYEGEEEGGPD